MIQDVAVKLGNIDTNVVTQALTHSTQRILGPRYMYAGLGDGGPCHPRDNIALRYLSQKLELGYDFFQGIVESRDKQAKNFAKFIVKIAKEKNLPVILHGKSFKRGLPYTHGSYSLLLEFYIKHEGLQTTFVDPLTDPTNTEITTPSLFVLTHPVNNEYPPYCTMPSESVVIDPWKMAQQVLALEVIPYGNTRLTQS